MSGPSKKLPSYTPRRNATLCAAEAQSSGATLPAPWRPGLTPIDQQYTQEFLTRIEHRLSLLSYREHNALLLYSKGLSFAEIAGDLHIGTETVKTHIYASRKKLGVACLLDCVWLLFRYDALKQRRAASQALHAILTTDDAEKAVCSARDILLQAGISITN